MSSAAKLSGTVTCWGGPASLKATTCRPDRNRERWITGENRGVHPNRSDVSKLDVLLP